MTFRATFGKLLLMNKSTSVLADLLRILTQQARALGLNDTAWSARAGLRNETLSRLRSRPSCDLATLEALSTAVGSRIAVTAEPPAELSPDGHFPLCVYRDYEQRLIELCASRSLNAAHWGALGPAFFMAGLAVMLASHEHFDRRGLLALAEQLHPGASEPAVFAQWLTRSALRPSRFLPMLEVAARHAA